MGMGAPPPQYPSTDPAALMQLIQAVQAQDQQALQQGQDSAIMQIRALNPQIDSLGAHSAPGMAVPPPMPPTGP